MNDFTSFRIAISFIILLCFTELDIVSAQGRWEALGSPVASALEKIISTSDRKLFVYMPYSGIQNSDDFGEHWKPMNEGLPNIQRFTTMIAGSNGTVFLVIDNTIYKLKNVQSEWELINAPVGKIDALYWGGNKRLFCILGPDVFVSDDEGLSFQFFLKSPVTYGQITQFAYTGNDENYFVDFTSSDSKLFRFDNQASHIDSITKFNGQVSNLILHSKGNLFMSLYSVMYRFNKLSKKLVDIKLDQNSNKVVKFFSKDAFENFISFDTMTYKSNDGGDTWLPLEKRAPIIWAGVINSIFLDSFLFAFSRSCDNSRFFRVHYFDSIYTDLTNTFTNPTVYSFTSDSTNMLTISTCSRYNPYLFSNYKNTLDQGKTWNNFQIGGKDVLNIKINSANKYYAVCNDTTYTSTDLGKTWTPFVYKIYPAFNFFIAPDHALYVSGFGGPYLERVNEDGSDRYFIEPGICCDGEIYGLLFHPNGRIYINWSNYLFYSDERGEHASKAYIQCNSCELSSKGDLYNIENGLYFIEPDLSNRSFIEPLSSTAKIVGHDHYNNVFVYDIEKGFLLCNRNGCKPFDMAGLPFPYMFIKSVYQDNQNYLYAGLRNDKIYKYSEPLVSSNVPVASDDKLFSMFPNPFSNILNCVINKSQSESYHVVIKDIYGRSILEAIEKQSKFQIETKLLSPGVYFIQLGDSGFSKIIKI